MKNYFEGKVINLRGLAKEDYTIHLFNWANDPEFNHYLQTGLKPSTTHGMEKAYDRLIQSDSVVFTMVDGVKPIGLIGLYNIDWQTRSTEYRIHIGETNYWGTSAAKEATDFILKYAFETLNLHKVWLGVNNEHERAKKFYIKMKFVTEGLLKDGIYKNGKYYDILRMSIIRQRVKKRMKED